MEECRNNRCISIEELNPTFLYTWKGTRDKGRDEACYHSHNHLELAIVLSGEGRYRFEDGIVCVKEGDVIIINPGVKHQALACPEAETPATEFFTGAKDFHILGCSENALPVPEGGHVLHADGELWQRLFKLYSAMEAEKAVCRQGRYFMLKAYLMQMMLLVIREACKSPEQEDGAALESVNRKNVVEQMVNYFEDHYCEKISLEQMAENMYLSPFYLSKIFKSETGDTPIRHLINIRLEKARERLAGGDAGSIQEVAASVGYDDAYHFSKLFKKRYGISPSQARKKA